MDSDKIKDLLYFGRERDTIESLLKKYGKLPESMNEQILRKIVRKTLMDEN